MKNFFLLLISSFKRIWQLNFYILIAIYIIIFTVEFSLINKYLDFYMPYRHFFAYYLAAVSFLVYLYSKLYNPKSEFIHELKIFLVTNSFLIVVLNRYLFITKLSPLSTASNLFILFFFSFISFTTVICCRVILRTVENVSNNFSIVPVILALRIAIVYNKLFIHSKKFILSIIVIVHLLFYILPVFDASCATLILIIYIIIFFRNSTILEIWLESQQKTKGEAFLLVQNYEKALEDKKAKKK